MKTILARLLPVLALVAAPAMAKVDGPNVTWRIATMGSPRAATTHIETIKKYVEEQTDGKFTINIGYGTFGDSREFLDLLKIGAIQGATVQASISVEKLPLYTALDLPFLPISGSEQQRAVHDMVNQQPDIVAEFADWNAFPFMSSLLPPYELMGTNETPEELSDISGMRLRALGGNGDALAKFGAVSTNMPPQEMYVALERGLLDGVALPYYAHVSYRTYELGKWMTTNMGLAGTGLPVVLNKQAWDDIPQQYKDLMLKAREVAYDAQIEAMKTDTEAAFKVIKDSGMELIQFSEDDLAELRKIGARPVWDAWLDARADHEAAERVLDFILDAAEKTSGK